MDGSTEIFLRVTIRKCVKDSAIFLYFFVSALALVRKCSLLLRLTCNAITHTVLHRYYLLAYLLKSFSAVFLLVG